MKLPDWVTDRLSPEAAPFAVAEGIWSVERTAQSNQVYDKHAALYDRLIGSTLYNRIAWGSSPLSYARFAHAAAQSGQGVLLDGGCGSLVSTVTMHVASKRQTILCDLSVGMLCAARDRLIAEAGAVPEHLVLLQADLTALPFKPDSFGSILCPGMLHIFEDVEAVTRELARVAATDAQLFMSSLIAERWIGRRYLSLLHRAGEVANPRRAAQLLTRLNSPTSGLRVPINAVQEGSMLFVTARPDCRSAD